VTRESQGSPPRGPQDAEEVEAGEIEIMVAQLRAIRRDVGPTQANRMVRDARVAANAARIDAGFRRLNQGIEDMRVGRPAPLARIGRPALPADWTPDAFDPWRFIDIRAPALGPPTGPDRWLEVVATIRELTTPKGVQPLHWEVAEKLNMDERSLRKITGKPRGGYREACAEARRQTGP
jgi:hypothetical protein